MLATIFLRTVLRLVNFLSLDSAACNSARNSYVETCLCSYLRQVYDLSTHLDLPPLEELGILGTLSTHGVSVLNFGPSLSPSAYSGM